MTRLLLAVLVVAACGEREIDGTACASSTDCNLFNAVGTCQATGFCSYPDTSCLSGERYAPAAGDSLGGSCFGDTTCGGKDQPCCGSVCGDNLTCVTDLAMCQCGAAGQPCCDGATCGTGLHCGTGATCSSNEVKQVAIGHGSVCALTGDGAVWCWGHDAKPFGRRGGRDIIGFDVPTPIAGIDNVSELRGGEQHTCAKKTDGTLWCWGHNDRGQLGDGSAMSTITPVQVSGLTNVTQFDLGRMHTCAVGTVAGTTSLYCWGRGGVESETNTTSTGSRLGAGTLANASTPVAVDLSTAAAAGQTVRSLSTGAYHTCIGMSDDTIWCWGRNTQGELGNGTVINALVPTQVNLAGITIPNGVTIVEVSCSFARRRQNHTCARLSDGATYCWGYNADGALGDGMAVQRSLPSLPVATTDLAGAKPVQLAAGMRTRCARMDTGDVWCWGENRNGLIGNNGTINTDFLTPQKVTLLSGVSQLAMRHNTACAIAGGALYCWGNNHRGGVTVRPPASDAEKAIMQPLRITL